MKDLLLTGATGLVGRRFLEAHGNRWSPILSLQRGLASPLCSVPLKRVPWEAEKALDLALFKNHPIKAVLHLAGTPIAQGRWSARLKQQIWDSRVLGTRHLVQALLKAPPLSEPRRCIFASAIGIYGEAGEELLSDQPLSLRRGTDFLSRLTQAWEEEVQPLFERGKEFFQVVILRFGLILDPQGGIFPKLGPFYFKHPAPPPHSPWRSWIHFQDVQRLLQFFFENPSLEGVFHGVSPSPVLDQTLSEMIRSFSRTKFFTPSIFGIPPSLIRLLLGEQATLLHNSQRVFPDRALANGFCFQFPSLAQACLNLKQGLPQK